MVCRYSRTEGRVVMVMVVAMVCTWSDGNVCEVDMSVCVSVCVTQCVCVCVCVCPRGEPMYASRLVVRECGGMQRRPWCPEGTFAIVGK